MGVLARVRPQVPPVRLEPRGPSQTVQSRLRPAKDVGILLYPGRLGARLYSF